MRIVFLCGSLEPGRDGVGDYTRNLAEEVIRQGHEAAIITLYDYFVEVEIKLLQNLEKRHLYIFRIPFHYSQNRRFKCLTEWIDGYDPEVLSLQFVPFSFHSKGYPFFLGKYLKAAGKRRAWHIMFHELWTMKGNRFFQWKQTFCSTLQRELIVGIVKQLQPTVVHTQLPAHVTMLKQVEIDAIPLSLFSNIAVASLKTNQDDDQIIRIGLFSQVKETSALGHFLDLFVKDILMQGKDFDVLMIGHEEKMKEFGEVLLQNKRFQNKIHYTGFLAPEEVSQFLNSCTVGLTPVPQHALGKSGTVAAFLTHGIPVAAPVVEPGRSYEAGFFDKNLSSSVFFDPYLEKARVARQEASACNNSISVSTITKKFLSDLEYIWCRR